MDGCQGEGGWSVKAKSLEKLLWREVDNVSFSLGFQAGFEVFGRCY